MRNRCWILFLSFFLAVQGLSAQTKGRDWIVSLGIGYDSMLPQVEGLRAKPEVMSSTLSEIYAPYYSNVASGFVFGASLYHRLGRVWELGVGTSYDRVIATRFDPVTDRETGLVTVNAVSLLPGLRLTFMDDGRFVRFYGGIAAGASFHFGSDTGEPFSRVRFSGEVVLAGLRLGRQDSRWRGVMELVVGSEISGVRVGAGYHF